MIYKIQWRGLKIQENNKPVKRIGIGAIRISIWKNAAENSFGSKSFYSVNIQKIYRDKQGNWQHTTNLSESDIPKAIYALSKAYDFVLEEKSVQLANEKTEDV